MTDLERFMSEIAQNRTEILKLVHSQQGYDEDRFQKLFEWMVKRPSETGLVDKPIQQVPEPIEPKTLQEAFDQTFNFDLAKSKGLEEVFFSTTSIPKDKPFSAVTNGSLQITMIGDVGFFDVVIADYYGDGFRAKIKGDATFGQGQRVEENTDRVIWRGNNDFNMGDFISAIDAINKMIANLPDLSTTKIPEPIEQKTLQEAFDQTFNFDLARSKGFTEIEFFADNYINKDKPYPIKDPVADLLKGGMTIQVLGQDASFDVDIFKYDSDKVWKAVVKGLVRKNKSITNKGRKFEQRIWTGNKEFGIIDFMDAIGAINDFMANDLDRLTIEVPEPIEPIPEPVIVESTKIEIPKPTEPIVETVIEPVSKIRSMIELMTGAYTQESVERLPQGSVVLQLDNRLDKLIVTPYIVSSDETLVDFYKSKHLNHMPVVPQGQGSVYVVLYTGKNISMKDNVLEGKKRLDILVGLLDLTFIDGSYVAEPHEEVKVEVSPQRPTPFGIGTTVRTDTMDKMLNLPSGAVFFSDTADNVYKANAGVITEDRQVLIFNSRGQIKGKFELDPNTLLKMGIFVIYVDQLDDLSQIEQPVFLKRLHMKSLSNFDEIFERKLRANPKPRSSRRKMQPFSQWGYMVNPLTRTIKQHFRRL